MAATRLGLGPSTRSVQALMVARAAEEDVRLELAAFAQGRYVMKRQRTPTLPAEEVAQSALTVA